MKVTQDQLNAPLKSISGVVFSLDKDTDLTMRYTLTEVILYVDDERSGTDRMNGVKVAEKVHTAMGELDFDETDVKLIEARMDNAPLLRNNDYLYTLVHRFLHPTKEVTEDRSE